MRVAFVLALAVAPALGTTFIVNSLEDSGQSSINPDLNPSCDLKGGCCAAGKTCTYRQAIYEAHEQHEATPIVIMLPAGQINISGEALDTLEEYDEHKHVTILGNANTSVRTNPNVSSSWRTVIDGNHSNILLQIGKLISVVVKNITFRRGNASALDTSGLQRNGGAISTSGNLEVGGCDFLNNAADAAGGAIANDGGQMNVSYSKFTGNTGKNGGAVSSAGKDSIMRMEQCQFRQNRATEAAGALQISRTAAAVITDTSFEDHFANQTGGAIQNGVLSNMSLLRCNVKVARAKNAGLVSNDGVLVAKDTTFEGGYAFDQYGGGVDNQGNFTCVGCAFRNNTAQQTLVPPTQSKDANGATLNMDQKAGASALLLNCTIEGSPNSAQEPMAVSEIYMSNKDVQLNLTFCTFTKCHDNMLMINRDKTSNTITMRGTHFCDTDGTETKDTCATTKNGIRAPGCAPLVKTCADATKEDIWQCGERALCSDLSTTGLGINCSCNNPSLHYEPPKPGQYPSMWGYPFGGAGPDMSPLEDVDFGFPLPAMRSGCFEQWNPYAANVSATLVTQPAADKTAPPPVELLPLWPSLNFGGDVETRTSAYTCVTRAAAGINWTVVANASDHSHINGTLLPNKTFEIALSEKDNKTFISTSFYSYAYDANVTDGKLITGNQMRYTLNVTMVPGDFFCEVGQANTTCFNASGAPALCVAKSYSPKDCLIAAAGDYAGTCEAFNGSMACSPGPSTAPTCPYAEWDFSKCHCDDCLAGALYACQCDKGAPDGTQTCSTAGKLSDCDCNALWSYPPPPSPPPPSSPPPMPPTPPPIWPYIAFPAAAAVLVAGAGLVCWVRRRSRQRLQREYQAALLNSATGEEADDAYVLQ